MANRKKPEKEAFERDRAALSPSIPTEYTNKTLELLAENGKLLRIIDRMRAKGTYTPRALKIYINNVRLGRAVDWDVLDALRKVANTKLELEPA